MSGRSVVVFDGTGDGGVSVDDDFRPRAPRAGSRRLRDISHLYISQRPAPGPVPPARRALRVVLCGRGLPAAECGASLAAQWARLGRRVLVLDLDASLPSIGFRLGLAPAAYLAPLVTSQPPRLWRAVLGIRVAVAPRPAPESTALVAEAARQSDVILVRVPRVDPHAVLQPYANALAIPTAATTIERAAARSPMFEAWMATARRPRAGERAAPAAAAARVERIEDLFDVAVPVGGADAAGAFAGVPQRPIVWGVDAPIAGWARIPMHVPPEQLPLSLLEPEHPVSRVFESLAQALMAGGGRRGGGELRV